MSEAMIRHYQHREKPGEAISAALECHEIMATKRLPGKMPQKENRESGPTWADHGTQTSTPYAARGSHGDQLSTSGFDIDSQKVSYATEWTRRFTGGLGLFCLSS